jgi:hypothetical protein
MKKGQLMGQPFIYMFYAIVGILILFFGIRVVVNLQDTGESVEYELFVSKIRENVEKVYHDSYGSTISLEKIDVPSFITEVCFVGDYQVDRIQNTKLKEVIAISDSSDYNVYFADVDPSKWERNFVEGIVIEGTICDITRDGKLNIILENIGTIVKIR